MKDKEKKSKKPDFGTQPQDNGQRTVSVDYFHLYESLYRREIDDWVHARTLRRDPFNPSTYHLQQLYKDALLDNHLAGAINSQRILPLLNKEFIIRDVKDEVDPVRSLTVRKKWFRDIIREALWSIFRGYSLIFVDNLASPSRTVLPIHRENVIPELGVIARNPLVPSAEHISFRDYPAYFLYAQLGDNAIGSLESIAPLTIYKRHSWASWDEYEQIFGLPIRIARTAINTQQHKDDLQAWLENMSTAAYAIFDKQTDIEIKDAKSTDAYHVYLEKINAINGEISKRVLGQTMTMEDGSSLSQSETHLKILNEVHKSDIAEVEEWVNDTLLPVMRLGGIDMPEGCRFAMQDHEIISPRDKIAIDQVLLNAGYNLDPDYIQKFYNTPLDKETPKKEQPSPSLSLSAQDFFA